MQKENNYTVGWWCDRWFCENQDRWSSSTVGGYRNLSHKPDDHEEEQNQGGMIMGGM